MPSTMRDALKLRTARGAANVEHQQQEDFFERYPELLGRVLGHLDDEERCRIITVVCQAWLRVHKTYPPPRTSLEVYCRSLGVVKPMVTWLMRISGTLERLEIHLEDPDREGARDQGLVSHMLCMAAARAPKLRHLSVHWMGACQAPLQSLTFFSKIKCLDISYFAFPSSPSDTVGLCGLTGLRALEVLMLEEVFVRNATADLADSLWTALASLPALASLDFSTCGRDFEGEPAPLVVLSSLSSMTQISALKVGLWHGVLGVDANLASVFDPLTQLTALTFGGSNQSGNVYTPCLRLPLLKKLKLGATSAIPQDVAHDGSLLAASYHLTSLMIRGGQSLTVPGLISMSTPALPRLHTLELAGGCLTTFPDEAATRLKRLVVLRLQRNNFARLPPAVALIQTLQVLDLSGNKPMQLVESDAITLSALKGLTELHLDKGQPHFFRDDASACMWTATSMQAALHIGRMLPQLNVHLATG